MITRNKPDVSLKAKYGKVIRISLIVSLVLVTAILVAVPRMEPEVTVIEEPDVQIENIEIPETQQYERPPAPSRPTIPVASEDEDIAEDVTIEETTFEEFEVAEAPPPAPEEGATVKFIPYDEDPELIGGRAALQRHLVYPELAKEAGVEGVVNLRIYINKDGEVEEVVVLKGVPKTGLDEAAIAAIKKTKWNPAKQRDKAVGVWYGFQVRFRLNDSS